MSLVHVVLLDADGVIQTPTATWRAAFDAIAGDPTLTEELLAEIFEQESWCLTGESEFPERLQQVLNRWGNTVSLAEALAAWTAIEPSMEVLDLVTEVRSTGTRVVVASSQEPYRARYMSHELGYAAHFDKLFFSCDIGHIKPAESYFTTILEELSIEPDQALFIDDNASIVDAASEIGLVARVFDLRIEPVSRLREILAAHLH